MTISYYIFISLLCIATLLLNRREMRQGCNTLSSATDKRYLIATQIVLFLGVLLRLIYLEYPFGINLDEAMAGYEAWNIAHYGTDQYLESYPVYLKSWGSGQNALYTYLAVPFVKWMGLTLPIVRLPMAIVSSVSLFSIYYALKKANLNQFFIFIALLFLAFNPWHFTKSRWALESNLAPDLLFIATSFIIMAYYETRGKLRSINFIIAFFFLGLTAYGYAAAWFMLPFYAIAIFTFLYKGKVLNIKQSIAYFGVTFIVVFPLLLFAIQLATGLEINSLGPLSISKLNESRHQATNLFALSGNQIIDFLWGTLKSLISGYDHQLTNSFPYTGQFYNIIGWIFILIGLSQLFKDKELVVFDKLFLYWLISCIPILIFVLYNINRWNMMWFPLIYFCVRGIYFCISKRRSYQIAFYTIFLALTVFFSINYLFVHYRGFLPDIENSVKITSQKNIKTVYFTPRVKYPAILFYDPICPKELNRTKEELYPGADFIYLKRFGKYNLEITPPLDPKPHTAYVVLTEDLDRLGINRSAFNIHEGEWLTVLWNE